MDNKREIWRPIEETNGRYFVSNLGRVKRVYQKPKKKELIMKQRINKEGYCFLTLCVASKKSNHSIITRFIHRLVAKAFIANPKNLSVVDHIDRNPLNNNVNNLRWVTIYQNANNTSKTTKTGKPHISIMGKWFRVDARDIEKGFVISAKFRDVKDAETFCKINGIQT